MMDSIVARWPARGLGLTLGRQLVLPRADVTSSIPKPTATSMSSPPTDFLAAITQHIPDPGAQMVRYCGWYSNKMRGQRHRTTTGGAAAPRLRPPASRRRPPNSPRKSGAT